MTYEFEWSMPVGRQLRLRAYTDVGMLPSTVPLTTGKFALASSASWVPILGPWFVD